MAVDYTEYVDLADELISEHGRSITVLKSGGDPVDADMPWRGRDASYNSEAPASEDDAIGVFLRYRERDLGGDIKRGDKMLLVAAKDQDDLSKHDGVRDSDDSVWRIIDEEIIKPGDTTLLYIFQVRQ